MISHLLGDFYFQTDSISENKKISIKYLMLHMLIYMLTIYGVYVLATGKYKEYIGAVLLVGVCHLVVDFMKLEVEKRCEKLNRYMPLLLIIDQTIHVIILWIFRQSFPFEINFNCFPGISIHSNEMSKIFTIIIAVLLCGKPAAILVALVFKSIPKTIHSAEKAEDKEANMLDQAESLRIGSWIGILEREIILVLGLMGQYGAIGFVLTAKSLARHNQLNNQAFAEKYLIGTLLSALIALLCIVICKCLM